MKLEHRTVARCPPLPLPSPGSCMPTDKRKKAAELHVAEARRNAHMAKREFTIIGTLRDGNCSLGYRRT